MMPEISLNILDVAENSTRAGASLVQITVDVQPNLDRLTVIIADDGCGMTKEQIARAFEPFYKADKARTRSAGGAGLGLPLCRKIARLCMQYDVRVCVDSDAHFCANVGEVPKALEMLDSIDFPPELIVNSTFERFEAYIAEREARMKTASVL